MTTLIKSPVSRDETPSRRFPDPVGGFARLAGGYQLLAGLVLAVFWVRSGLAHLANPYYFLSSVYSYEIVGPTLGRAAAMVLPVLQLVLAACLVSRQLVGGALAVSAGLLAVFTAAQGSAFARGLQIGCGCFGAVERQAIGGESLTTVGLLLFCALSGFACWVSRPRGSVRTLEVGYGMD